MKGSNSVILNPPVYVLMHLNNKNIIYNYNILTSCINMVKSSLICLV